MNLCGEPGEASGGDASNGQGGSDASDGQNGNDASMGPDGCSFACPTRAHWISGTFTVTYASPSLPGGNVTADGRFLPLVHETISFVVSFDEGAMTKQPQRGGQYALDIILSQADISYQGDATGLLDTYLKPSVETAKGNADFNYGANEKMTVGVGSSYGISFSCDNLTLPVGSDQYIIPGDVNCSAGSAQISGDWQTDADFANASGTFVYH
jgi:hypothetical protein